MPTRFIHSRSSLMPSLVMLPFIQCHQTRGLALSGGFWKPRASGSPEFCAETIHAPTSAVRRTTQPACLARFKSCIYFYPFRFQCNPNHGARRNEFGTMPGAGKIPKGRRYPCDQLPPSSPNNSMEESRRLAGKIPRVREESMKVNAEFAAIERDLDEPGA